MFNCNQTKIPTKIIGYTVLKTYNKGCDFNSRYFWGIRDYAIHLCGTEIIIQSLAFQEQDSVLAACATTAIWSMLNKASLDFVTILKSPSQITRDADKVSPDGSRLFPNKGLNLLQICQAIVNSGLVSEIKQPDLLIDDNDKTAWVVSSLYLKKIMNAYAPIGIPLILVINVPNGDTFGLHAITISGYKQTPPVKIPPKEKISWLANNIEKFYAHDDQWGPFARIDFLNDHEIESPWTVADPNKRATQIMNIVVPVYPKIRISYEDIEVIVLGLDRILTFFFDNAIVTDLVWDIKIDYSENYKHGIKDLPLHTEQILKLIEKSLPKYIWIASCFIAGYKVLEFTFDATDVNSGMFGIDIISFLPAEIYDPLITFLNGNRPILQELFHHVAKENYYDFLLRNI